MWLNTVDFQFGKMFNTFLILLLLLDISENLNIGRLPVEQGLYTVNDSVIILTIDNLKEQIYGRNRACLVEFYSSWCGHCVRYAPIWKAFGRNVRHWQDIAAVGVIDCSNEANGPICTYFEINKYPTLLYFHEMYMEDPQNLGVPVPISPDYNDNRKNFIALLIKDQANGKGSVFPNLQAYHDSNISNIFNTSKGMPKYAFLIVQDPSNFVGAEITMDFHKISDVIVRYSYNNNTNLLKNLDINSNFALVVIDRNYISTVLLASTFLNRTILEESIKQFLISNHVNIDDIDDESNSNKFLTTRIDVSTRERSVDTVFLGDLENALIYSLKQEVGRVKQITGDRLEALKNYINVLVKYFPFGNNGKVLLQQINDLTGEKAVSGIRVSQMIQEAQQPHKQVFTSPHRWIACQGSAPHYRGYPCGLWTMFHYLTVNAVNNENNDHSYSNEVLKAMHGYITNYFGCGECREHFQEMASKRGLFNVASYNDSVLWLWRAHNQVNQRLAGDLTEDPQHPKIQFPSKSNCPQCYQGDTWNEGEVLQYLKQIYGRDNLYTDISQYNNYALKSNIPTNTSGVPFITHTNFMVLIASALAILRTIYIFY